MAYTPGSQPDRQSRIARLSQGRDQVGPWQMLLSQGGWPTGGSNQLKPSIAPLRRPELYNPGVNGTLILASTPVVTIPAGQQSTALPPSASPRARDYSIAESFPLTLISRDAMTAGAQSVALPPIAASRARDYSVVDFASLALTSVTAPVTSVVTNLPPTAAARARDYSFTAPFPLTLVGRDAMATGAQSFVLPPKAVPRSVDLLTYVDASENWLFGTDAVNAGQQRTELPPLAAARARDYTWSQTLVPILVSQDAMATGSQLSGNAPAGAKRSVDLLTFVDPSENWLFGTDAVTAGAQRTEWPPIGALRARDYTFAPPVNLCCLTTVVQQIPYGQQSTDSLPARSAARARDYTWQQSPTPVLVGRDAMAAGVQISGNAPPAARRAVDYTHTQDLVPNLIGQDAMLVGRQSTELPPIAPSRAKDYTFAPPVNLCCLTTVVQQIPYGAQSTDSLPAHAALRARDYTWSQELIPTLVGQDALNAGEQSFDLAPSPAPLRARDYSISESFPLTLISQDALTVGEQRTELPPIAALRARDYSFVPPINLACLTTVVQVIPCGQQSTDSLPARAPARIRDYTWIQELIPDLIGQDQMNAGAQSFALAPSPAPLRARDYSFTAAFPLVLIGRDAMVVGSQWLHRPPYAAPRVATLYEPGVNFALGLDAAAQKPIGKSAEASALPPKAAARARDYTWLQSLPLLTTQILPTGQSSLESEGPPRGPLRARDYTFLDLTKRHLIGQDSMTVGESTFISDLPPRAYPRAQNLITGDVHNMISLITTPRRDLVYAFNAADGHWTFGSTDGHWTLESAGSHWDFGTSEE